MQHDPFMYLCKKRKSSQPDNRAQACCRSNTFKLRHPGGKIDIDINLDERRLASADRNNKATLLLTALPHTIKSSAKDLSQRKVKLQYVS